MKRLSALILLLCCPAAHAAADGNVKFGFADYRQILSSSTVIQTINDHSKKLADEYDKFVNDQNSLLNSDIAPERRQEIENAINEKRKNLDIALRINSRKLEAYYNHIRQVIKELAAQRGISLVTVSQDFLLLTGDYDDITGELIQRLNNEHD